MQDRHAKVLLHLASPTPGNDVRRLVRELAALAGVARVVPSSRVPRALFIDYDPAVTGVQGLLACARRGWTGACLVSLERGAS